MRNNKIQIKVGCGSGLATATCAMDYVRNIIEEESLPAEVTTCRVTDLRQYDSDPTIDILLSTSRINPDNFQKPIMSVFGFISGINYDKLRAQLVEMIKGVMEEQGLS